MPYQNVLSLCGAGRNVGKTFLGAKIIEHFSKEHPVIAVKISKFKHQAGDKAGLNNIKTTPAYSIWEERQTTNKDSGRYLKAGALKSYYIETIDEALLNAFQWVYDQYSQNYLFVCESASLTKYLQPAISVFVDYTDQATPENKLGCLKRSAIILKALSPQLAQPQTFLKATHGQWELLKSF